MADTATSVRVTLDDVSQVGRARRAALAVASDLGIAADIAGNIGLVATELATNLVRHAREGAVIVRPLEDPPRRGVEMLAVDKGPGIRDVAVAMRDGFSTAGTPGTGLGAVRRISSEFDVYSTVDSGTVLVARLWDPGVPRGDSANGRYVVGAVCVPMSGESECGDSWVVQQNASVVRVAIVDGLGHGHEAAVAASEAMRVVRELGDASPVDVVQSAHGPLRATRGAAIAVATIDRRSSVVEFAGIGNIVGTILGASSTKSLASHAGIVGHQMRHVHQFTYDWPSHGYLVLHSDGLSARWRADAYPGLIGHDPAILAGVLHRDFARTRDDATVLVVHDAAD